MATSRRNPAIVPMQKGGRTVYAIAGTRKWFSTRERAEEELVTERAGKTKKGKPRKQMKAKYSRALGPTRAVDAWLSKSKSGRAMWNGLSNGSVMGLGAVALITLAAGAYVWYKKNYPELTSEQKSELNRGMIAPV